MITINKITDFVQGIKTEDDRVAKNLLKDFNNIRDIRRGSGRSSGGIDFKYKNCSIEIYDGWGEVYKTNDGIKIKSKLLSKLFYKLRKDLDKKEAEENLVRIQKLKMDKDIEFKNALIEHGGIEGIAETILKNIENPQSFWKGQIRIDSNTNERSLIMLAPINETTDGRRQINTIIVNLSTGKIHMEKSYGAYWDHKQYDGTLTELELKSLDKYILIANKINENKTIEKNSILKNLYEKN